MIEKIKYATISDIYVKDLIFYDSDRYEEQINFCNELGISYLPGKDRKSCYRLNGNSFEIAEISDELRCNPFDRLFDDATISKFENGSHDEVMFVVEGNKIKGVVHIVDYNNEFINYEFYKAIYRIEIMLRQYMILKGESNNSMLSWMKNKAEKSDFWYRRYLECVPEDPYSKEFQEKKRKDCNPFQTFYLNDLLMFAASMNYVSKNFKRNIETIKNIRNWVAHNKDLAHKTEYQSRPLYRIDELKSFAKGAQDFFGCYEELEERIQNVNLK